MADGINGSERIDLTNCDREPIHILGAIQPFGFLLALATDWLIVRASENVAQFLGTAPDALIGRPLHECIPAAAAHDLRNRVAMMRGPEAVERLFGCILVEHASPFDVAIHISGGQIVLEAEPGSTEHGDATGMVRSMISRLDQCETNEAFFREGARQIRALTGFDRVMVYRFAPDLSGEVISEACRPGIGRFLGLHYPASDIPAQARLLYRRNLLRIIADIEAVPVKIVPQRDETGAPLDLSLSVLRAVSPIHIEYLKNMGVGASMSISIIADGRLWGLFACHHYGPRCPTFERRSAADLFAQMFSMRLESRERQAAVDYERRARDISDQLLSAAASDEALLRDPEWLGDILTTTIPADGVGVWINGNLSFSGTTPNADDFRRIIRALNGTAAGRVFATDRIAALVPGAEQFAETAAGMLAIPISRSPRDYVVLFRREQIRSVRWAGDPHKPTEYGDNGPRLTPRASFAEWKQTVQGLSSAFTPSELRVAETLRATLIEVVLRLAEEASTERQAAAARQEVLIAELNHRVRNILGVIRGLVRQSRSHNDSVEDFVQLVDGRIHALARAHNQITDDHWGPAPIGAIIDAEAAAFGADGAGRVIADGEPLLLNPQAYATMALVIHELITNSTKYGSLSVPQGGRVLIGWHRNAEGDLLLDWREEGGPKVLPPKRQGFGTTIIDRSVPYDLGGTARLHYLEEGVAASFCIPARHISKADAAPGRAPRPARPAHGHPARPPEHILDGKTMLLVEDSLIIALDAEDILTRLGATHVYTAASIEAALELVDTVRPDLAMLDINLGERSSFPIADRLDALGIPFMFATGYGEQSQLPEEHKPRAVVQKPYTIENVARSLDQLINDAAR